MRILIVENHHIVREGIKKLLMEEKDFEVVGEAANGREALDVALEVRPDLVIMDLSMPELNGVDATRQLLKIIPNTKVIALSMYLDSSYIRGMVESGAKGYILKDNTFKELRKAIREVAKGNLYFSPELNNYLVAGYLGKQDGSAW